MKIAVLSTAQIPSSTANSIQVMKVSQALAQAGADVMLFAPGNRTAAWSELAGVYGLQDQFELRWLPSRRQLRRYDYLLSAWRVARSWGADLIYTWMPQAAVVGLRARLKVVLEIHDRPSGRMGPWWYRQYQAAGGTKKTLIISRALNSILADEYGLRFPPAEVQIAPNGVDLERYYDLPAPPDARARLRLPERMTAVYSGHLYAGRGLDLLLGLASCIPQVNFLLVGGRPDAVEAARQLAQVKRLDNVRLTGFVENQRLPLYQAAGEFLLMPYERRIAGSSGGNSVDVASPMKMFEYLAAGRAILSSDLPVLREVLNPGNALLLPPEDLPAWQAGLESLLDDPDRRKKLGRQARLDAQGYTWRERARRALEGFSG